MPRSPLIRIPERIIKEIVAHSQSSHPQECCGLLIGRVSEAVYEVTERIPLLNTLQSEREFESDPAEMLQAHRYIRQKQRELLVVYHSHPASRPIPSRSDRQRSIDSKIACLIIGPGAEIQVWWLMNLDEHYAASWELIEENAAPE